MAIMALTALRFEFNAADESDHVANVQLAVDVEQLDVTDFASAGWKETIGGLKGGTVTVTFHDDFAVSDLDASIWAQVGNVVAIKVRPTNSAISTSNPEYQFNVLVNQTRVGGQVGQVAQKSLTWPVTGAVTRATS